MEGPPYRSQAVAFRLCRAELLLKRPALGLRCPELVLQLFALGIICPVPGFQLLTLPDHFVQRGKGVGKVRAVCRRTFALADGFQLPFRHGKSKGSARGKSMSIRR